MTFMVVVDGDLFGCLRVVGGVGGAGVATGGGGAHLLQHSSVQKSPSLQTQELQSGTPSFPLISAQFLFVRMLASVKPETSCYFSVNRCF